MAVAVPLIFVAGYMMPYYTLNKNKFLFIKKLTKGEQNGILDIYVMYGVINSFNDDWLRQIF